MKDKTRRKAACHSEMESRALTWMRSIYADQSDDELYRFVESILVSKGETKAREFVRTLLGLSVMAKSQFSNCPELDDYVCQTMKLFCLLKVEQIKVEQIKVEQTKSLSR